MNIFLGIIGPSMLVVLFTLYVLTTLYSLFLIVKNEKSLHLFLWILFVLLVPIVGSVVYIFNYFSFINKMKAN